ncbi:MAG: hypothetical protein HYU73_14095, partial [Betaproteobacteria bacterium]|nr:hypothetical protein [Betaproteobacteria bacterium]
MVRKRTLHRKSIVAGSAVLPALLAARGHARQMTSRPVRNVLVEQIDPVPRVSKKRQVHAWLGKWQPGFHQGDIINAIVVIRPEQADLRCFLPPFIVSKQAFQNGRLLLVWRVPETDEGQTS